LTLLLAKELDMNRWMIALVIGASLSTGTFAQEELAPPPQKSPPAPLTKAQRERASYAVGLDIGRTLQAQELDIEIDTLIRGIRDALANTKSAFSDKEMHEAILLLKRDSADRLEKKTKALAAKNKAEGERFLALNAKKAGVKSTKSGLQYKVLKEGSGASPKSTDRVRTHYHGTFINGDVFDSSVERGEPAVFRVNGVIPGWTEALQMMKVGSKWQLYVPAALAYSEDGRDEIPPNATLIFDVELLGIEKTDPQSE
jgi:FKBP-type peptidyl-prolyl cis-trans isomerase FklB